jgi:hypothetical protein
MAVLEKITFHNNAIGLARTMRLYIHLFGLLELTIEKEQSLAKFVFLQNTEEQTYKCLDGGRDGEKGKQTNG